MVNDFTEFLTRTLKVTHLVFFSALVLLILDPWPRVSALTPYEGAGESLCHKFTQIAEVFLCS